LKICDVTQFYSPYSGGVRRYVEQRQSYINSTGEHRHVLIIPGDRTDSAYRGRSVVYRIHSPKIDGTCDYRAIINLERVREIIRVEKPDLIECADPYQLAWMILDLSRELKIPAVAFYHSHFPEACFGFIRRFGTRLAASISKYSRLYVNHLYNRFRQTLVPSPGLAEVLMAWGVSNVASVNLGVDTSMFTFGPCDEERRKELNVTADQTLLLYVGRLAFEKNLRTLVRAFGLLDDVLPGRYRLHFIGQGSLESDLLKLARTRTGISIQSYVSDSNELVRNYRAADIFVHPGMHETFGLVTLEAQACGLPVIGIRGTFMDSLAFNGIDHWASENSPESLAFAISKFSTLGMRDMGATASRAAHCEYSWTEAFKRLFDLYDAVLSS
jgi:alpha-1,6-mannosyltransferase